MRALGIFATVPIPRWVKPRLADEVGASTAAEVCGRVGRAVVEAAVTPGYRTTVWYAPSHEGAYVREWLEGLGPIELRPQSGGTPGARIAHAFARHFTERARPVVLIGADTPGIDRRLIVEAFASLRRHDVVLGPTHSGGFYLIGLSAPTPGLFRNLPWVTTAVSAQLRSRAQGLGLSLRLFPPLREIETARDARAVGYLKA